MGTRPFGWNFHFCVPGAARSRQNPAPARGHLISENPKGDSSYVLVRGLACAAISFGYDESSRRSEPLDCRSRSDLFRHFTEQELAIFEVAGEGAAFDDDFAAQHCH